jgi:hypothetical protein
MKNFKHPNPPLTIEQAFDKNADCSEPLKNLLELFKRNN